MADPRLDGDPGPPGRRRGENKADRTGGQAEQALGRGRGGFGTKGHVRVTGLGLPTHFVPTPGQAADVTRAPALLAGTAPAAVIAGRGYDRRALVEGIGARGGGAVIPTQPNRAVQRAVDRHLYRERNRVERFWARAKQCRRVATRCDKTARHFLAFGHTASIMILLRQPETVHTA